MSLAFVAGGLMGVALLGRMWRRWAWLDRRRHGAEKLRRRGDAFRAAGRLRDAGVLYATAADFRANPRVRIQAGHMFKEVGDWTAAEEQYLAALADLPDDVDLAVQLGHFHKVTGRPDEAIAAYQRAVDLMPGQPDATRELATLRDEARELAMAVSAEAGLSAGNRLPPIHSDPVDAVVLRRFGSAPTIGEPYGLPILKGVEAIRGVCVSAALLERAELLVDGVVVGGASLVPVDSLPEGMRKHVFNIWHDFGVFPTGLHTVEVRVADAKGTVRYSRTKVFVGTTLREADHPDSDGVVDPPADEMTRLDDWIAERPSMIRPARPGFFTAPPRSILVIRADQLGDLVVSLPALRRLRALFPGARLIGLLTSANLDLARSLELFDEIETVEWDRTAPAGVRRLKPAEERRVRIALEARRPDAAIDLLVSDVSRHLLALSGAPFTAGFGDPASPWMTLDQLGHTHDVRTGHEMAPHAARLLGLVERFATMVDCGAAILPLPGGEEARLGRLALAPGRYAIVHTGGRYLFSRWPGYRDLVDRLLGETDLDVVILDADAAMAAAFRDRPRIRVLRDQIAFADFDALLGFAAVFVGNDSGPKHLAALRGTPVVSVHSARADWREWGQTQTGLIVTRRLPCAGCSLDAEQEDECGRGYACINDIRVDEVFGAVRSLLG